MDRFGDDLLLVVVPDDHLVLDQELVGPSQSGRDPRVLIPDVVLDPGEPVPGQQSLGRKLVSYLKHVSQSEWQIRATFIY